MKRLTLALLGVWLLPGVLFAQANSIVLDLTDTRPGTYYYTIVVDNSGNATVQKIQRVVHVGNGDTPTPSPAPTPAPTPAPAPAPSPNPFPFFPINPTPTPAPPIPPQPDVPPPAPVQPVQATVEDQVQDLTRQAFANGGSVKTAVYLQRVYNIVHSALSTQQIAKERAIDALHNATDLAMEQQGEGPKWSAWRAAVSSIINNQRPNTANDYVAVLRKVEYGIKAAYNTTIAADRSQDLKDSDYDTIARFQERVIATLPQYKGGKK